MLEKCLNIQDCLEKSLIIKFALKSTSGAGSDNNHAHPDTSMKLGRNVLKHELLEFFS